ncbi:MAG: glycosyltransferase [FCB group bacterium]|nr:glycosyltransferase [FCB group bacterium]
MPTAMEKGEALFAEGKVAEANVCFEEIIKADPKEKQAYNNLGVIACHTGEAAKAVTYFSQALAIDSLYVKTLDNVLELLVSIPPGQAAASPEIACLFLHALLARGQYEDITPEMMECSILIDDENRLGQLLLLAVCHAAPDVPAVVTRLITAMSQLDENHVKQIQVWQNASDLTPELQGDIDALVYSKSVKKDLITDEELKKLAATGKKPKISILVPTFNRCDLLKRTLQNLASQEYPDFEIIVVDDCSTDDTPAVIENFKNRYPDHIYHRNEHNLGAGPNYNLAASLATGEYLLVFSDDDYLTRGALHQFVAPLNEDDYDFVYPDYQVIDDKDRPTESWNYRTYPNSLELIRHLIRGGGNVIPECLLLKRNLYDEFYGDNYDRRLLPPFYLAALDQLKIAHVSRALYQYRIHSEGMFASKDGLIDRNKGAVNYLNAIGFKYDPIETFNTGECSTPSQAIGEALLRAVQCFILHGKRYFEGTFYTGQDFTESDQLYAGLYEAAYYWLRLARKYLAYDEKLDQIEASITEKLTADYNPVKVNGLAEIYHQLPWYCFRPPGNFTRFTPLDMITLGENPFLNRNSLPVYEEGKVGIAFENTIVDSITKVEQAMERRIVRVINVCRPELMEPLLNLLEEKHLYFMTVIDFTGTSIPGGRLIKQLYQVDGELSSMDDYLDILWASAGGRKWPTTDK